MNTIVAAKHIRFPGMAALFIAENMYLLTFSRNDMLLP